MFIRIEMMRPNRILEHSVARDIVDDDLATFDCTMKRLGSKVEQMCKYVKEIQSEAQ